MTITSAILLLLLVLDPFGNIPLFVSALAKVDPTRHQKIIIREVTAAFIILIFFLFFGKFFLDLLHISSPALNIAGGIILFLIALKMIFPQPDGIFGTTEFKEPFLVPLAIPLIAGPSSLTTVLLLSTREPSRLPEWLLAIGVVYLISLPILLLSSKLNQMLGSRVLTALERLMGMVLTTIAVEMLLNGIREFVGR